MGPGRKSVVENVNVPERRRTRAGWRFRIQLELHDFGGKRLRGFIAVSLTGLKRVMRSGDHGGPYL